MSKTQINGIVVGALSTVLGLYIAAKVGVR